jgi:membrane associated rhomboid family serine protease
MLPLREVRPRPLLRSPAVVYAFILANLAAFLWELGLVAAEGKGALLDWAFTPQSLSTAPLAAVVTIFTSMFLHGGWLHLLGNLWFLWIFGPSVAEAVGARRFAALYLGSGVAAALAQAAFDPVGLTPMLGASGAIGGVLAAYVSLYPRRRIDTLFFLFVLPIPALFFVLEWFAMNLLRGLGSLAGAQSGGVAWWAHVGGFLAGLLLVRLLFPRARPTRRHAPPRPREVEVVGADGTRYAVRTLTVDALAAARRGVRGGLHDGGVEPPSGMPYVGRAWPHPWS